MNAARQYRFMLVPFVAGTIALVALPALVAAGLSLTDYDALSAPKWVGLGNYAYVVQDRVFQIALGNSLVFVALAVPLRLAGAFGLALWSSGERRGVGGFRAIVYLPSVIPDAAYALMWLWIVNPVYGPLNLLLKSAGLPQPGWLADPAVAKYVFVMMSALQIGEGFAVALAGLKGIPAERYQAAVVDGAGRWALLRHVTLPISVPWLALMSARDVIAVLPWTFAPTSMMTGGEPYYATLFIPLYARIQSMDFFQFGHGAAATLIMVGLAAVAVVGIGLAARRSWSADEV